MVADFPVHDVLFPQVSLSSEDVAHYKRLAKDRLQALTRLVEGSSRVYQWQEQRARNGALVQRAKVVDVRPTSKASYTSTLLKSSVLLRNTRCEEVMQVVAKVNTEECRKMMRQLHGDAFVDTRTLFKFPSKFDQQAVPGPVNQTPPPHRADHCYRAIKWCAFQHRAGGRKVFVDFSFLEYAGQLQPTAASNVVGFCLQEPVARNRLVPTLQNYGVVRAYPSRWGVIISRTHDPRSMLVTSVCQIDGDVHCVPEMRTLLEDVMQEYVGAIMRVQRLIDVQRLHNMKLLEPHEWIAKSARKQCAVCQRRFYLHRKRNCFACGEIMCSVCAPTRKIDVPFAGFTEVRICGSCMAKAGEAVSAGSNEVFVSNDDMTTTEKTPITSSSPIQPLPQFPRIEKPKAMARQRTMEAVAMLSSIVSDIRVIRDAIHESVTELNGSGFGEEEAYQDLYRSMRELESAFEQGKDVREEKTKFADSIVRTQQATSDYFSEDLDHTDRVASMAKMTMEAADATRKGSHRLLDLLALDESLISNPKTEDNSYVVSEESEDDYLVWAYDESNDLDITQSSASSTPPLAPRNKPVAKSSGVRLLENKIADLQRDLDQAQRTLAFLTDESDADADGDVGMESDLDTIEELHEELMRRGQQDPIDIPPDLAPRVLPDRMLRHAPEARPMPITHNDDTLRDALFAEECDDRRSPRMAAHMVRELHGIMNSTEMTKPMAASREWSDRTFLSSSPPTASSGSPPRPRQVHSQPEASGVDSAFARKRSGIRPPPARVYFQQGRKTMPASS